MTLAQDPTLSGGPFAQRPPTTDDLIELADAAGAGLLRVDIAGIAAALNANGALLLEALGGEDGALAPACLRAALAEAALDGRPAVRDAAALTPEARHICVTALVRGEEQFVALRDQTGERLLQERLLQSEKMASVGQLVSGVAHELNNPLTAVTGFAQVILGRPELDPGVRAHLQRVYEEGERAAKIVQNLLSFARRRRPAKLLTDINVLVERVLELRSYDFGLRNISLDMALDRRMPLAKVDPDQVQQVLFNLVTNAEQAMIEAHGGGRLTVRSESSPGGDGVRVSIADDGPGIPPEIQRRIFDPFFTTKEAGQGTGLGLTVSYGIIDEHGGRIWTENLVGADGRPAGAVFTIELPVAHASAQPSTELEEEAGDAGPPQRAALVALGGGASADRAPSPSRCILVVDDEAGIRELLSEVLSLSGHRVEAAATGIEAMHIIAAGGIDVVVSDIKMPGMDGVTLYRELGASNPALARRLIFITGDTVSADTRAFLARVSNPVLAKPFKLADLRAAIESVTGGETL